MALTIPVERIDAEARALDPVKMLLTVIAFVPFVLGWLAGKVWLTVAWLLAAARVGWQEARAPRSAESDGG